MLHNVGATLTWRASDLRGGNIIVEREITLLASPYGKKFP